MTKQLPLNRHRLPVCSSTSLPGSIVLILSYGYMLLQGARLLSDGSELLLQVLNPGIIGGLLLPVLGALPDSLVIVVSGLGGSHDEAAEQARMHASCPLISAYRHAMDACMHALVTGACNGVTTGECGCGDAGRLHNHAPHSRLGQLAACWPLRPGCQGALPPRACMHDARWRYKRAPHDAWC